MDAPSRYILHADLDAFYASVEQHDNPSLKGKPVVVGGSSEGRGVVAAASYEARRFGVRSAMPMRTALRLCPHLICVRHHFDRYHEVSQQVMTLFHAITELVEPLSLDEAYLDVTAAGGYSAAETLGRRLRAEVRLDLGLAITIGGGSSKTVAKTASRKAKPDGLLLVALGLEASFLAPLPVDMLWGVGPKTAEQFRLLGVKSIGTLASRSDAWLARNFGNRGLEMKERALGLDSSPVSSHHERKSLSSETTLDEDEGDEQALLQIVDELADRVAEGLREHDLRAGTVTVKLRLSDFMTFTRQAPLQTPTNNLADLQRAARDLVLPEILPDRRFRLLGVGATNFADTFQLPLASLAAGPPGP